MPHPDPKTQLEALHQQQIELGRKIKKAEAEARRKEREKISIEGRVIRPVQARLQAKSRRQHRPPRPPRRRVFDGRPK
jgi:hypothetical protein